MDTSPGDAPVNRIAGYFDGPRSRRQAPPPRHFRNRFVANGHVVEIDLIIGQIRAVERVMEELTPPPSSWAAARFGPFKVAVVVV